MDRIDEMLERLREALPEITWDRDAMSEDADLNCGAVEMTPARELYADGRMIAQTHGIDVWLCVSDSSSAWRGRVQAVLQEMAGYDDFTWAFSERRYAPNIDQVVWRWRCESLGLEVSPERLYDLNERRLRRGEDLL